MSIRAKKVRKLEVSLPSPPDNEGPLYWQIIWEDPVNGNTEDPLFYYGSPFATNRLLWYLENDFHTQHSIAFRSYRLAVEMNQEEREKFFATLPINIRKLINNTSSYPRIEAQITDNE